MTVSVSPAACLVTTLAGVVAGVAEEVPEEAPTGATVPGKVEPADCDCGPCDCAVWLCVGGATGGGKYFFISGCSANITMNASKKTSISRFSLPGSCCGF
jgi:hypothetical protein